MTYIFDVITWGRDGNTLDGRLTSLIGRDARFYRGPEFGLQLLMDAWFQGFGAVDIDDGTAKEFEECFELFLGKRVWIDAKGNVLDEHTKEPVEPKVNAYKAYEGQLDGSAGAWGKYTILTTKPRGEEFLKRTEAIIASFAIEPEGDGEHAEFTIQVTDPRYLAHMGKHASFETAFTGHVPR
ncbi:hypothetical protein [Glycomyces terrestris]|uniref:Uncharacterized protein n=1 Tax=Glycomyces terrestris TaxID=2493553 RepID=A0A426V0V7_9ACTN|nr:hypothetical protein [Glycomyces terrestris]RRS00473.1 hypothetical protein EIW28_07885 [Glycomyces terrestris]